MLSALEGVLTIDKIHLIDPNLQTCITALVDLLQDHGTGRSSIAEGAGRVILQLAEERLHFEILTSSGILEAIVRILSSEPNTDSLVTLIKILLILGDMATQIDCTEIVVEAPAVPAVLVKSLFNAEKAALQLDAATTQRNRATGEFAGHKIIRFPGAIEQFMNLLYNSTMPGIQQWAVKALCDLYATEETTLMVINCPRALEQIGKMLSLENNLTLHPDEFERTLYAVMLLHNLARMVSFMELAHMKYAKQKFNDTEGLMDGLRGLLADQIPSEIQRLAIGALTFLYPALGNGLCLHSAAAYATRGFANLVLGLNKESLRDLYEVNKIRGLTSHTLRLQVTAKVRLGDCQGALADANTAEKIDQGWYQNGRNLQERGVLKRMIGDLPGALADLDKGVGLTPGNYDLLKQRGLVRFMMNDEEGARSDAEMALKVKHCWVDRPWYGSRYLGTTSVEFLDYKLK